MALGWLVVLSAPKLTQDQYQLKGDGNFCFLSSVNDVIIAKWKEQCRGHNTNLDSKCICVCAELGGGLVVVLIRSGCEH